MNQPSDTDSQDDVSATPSSVPIAPVASEGGNPVQPAAPSVPVSTELKPLSAADLTVHQVHPQEAGEDNDSDVEGSEPPVAPLDPLGFWFGGGFLLGSGLHEHPEKKNDFDSAVALGPLLKFRFAQFWKLRLGLNLGFIYFAHHMSEGNDTIHVTTQYSRFQTVGTVQFHARAFYVTGLFGAAFTIVSMNSELTQNGTTETSELTGIDSSYLMGLDVGLEFGKHLFKLKREMEVAAAADWTRRGERDDISIFFNLNVELISKFDN
ncbi:MAG: hypothetical protein JXX29_00930 [Deltaproteobacteria bacterium]|nr:hypothetical protein [Deltaproteobacteria bacterium]MBN2670202.1 hypothetical protein [Deltaproteobacteria bacterium]